MKCPKCHSENRDGAKYCDECAHSLTIFQEPIPGVPTFDEILERIQRYLPRGITDKILAQRDKIEGERKQVTVMFCDIAGFTPLVEELGSDETYSVMDRVYEILIHCVHDYEGTVNEMTGDGIMALFGAPIALEDAPQRALRSALSIHKEISQFNQENNTKRPTTPILMRIGIHTGYVVVGTLGNDLRVEFKAVGDTVNLASRMEELAEPATIYVSHETYALTKELFRFEALGKKDVKGKRLPISVYKAISAKEDVYRPRVGSERMIYSEMVGRDKELDKLELQVMKVVNGEGSVVNIIGEAGIGKSRLVAELKKQVLIERVTLLEGRAVTMGRNLSFHPIIDFLRQWAGIKEDDTQISGLEKLTTSVSKVCPEDVPEVLPFVATLMALKPSGRHAERLDGIEGEGLQKLILKNIKDLLVKISEGSPLVIVMEDMHWADTSSIELLESLFRLVKTARIVFVNVLRPDHKDTGQRIVETVKEMLPMQSVEIILNSLDDRMTGTLIKNMLRAKGVPNRLIDRIVERSGGNPFFIEEVVRSFIDEGAIMVKDSVFEFTEKADQMTIPYTITDVLMARIDRLEQKTRDLVRVASVIGRSFFFWILREVAKTTEDIDGRLSYLKDIQFIRERQRMEELEFLFKHALAQEAAYESILHKKRVELHRKIADTIEKIFKEKLYEFYGMLALHYTRGEDEEKAEEYLIKAGEEALKSSASSEALHYCQEALNLYQKRLGGAADTEKVAMLEKNVANAFFSRGMFIEAIEYFERVLASYGEASPTHLISAMWRFSKDLLFFLASIYFPSLRFRKTPTRKDKEVLDLLFKKMACLVLTDTKRYFVESISFFKRLTTFDLGQLRRGVGAFALSAAQFYFSGISFRLGRRILDLAKIQLKKEDVISSLDCKGHDFYHRFFSGDWTSIKEYDSTLVDLALSVGEFNMSSIYYVFYGILECNRGDFASTQRFIHKLEEMAGLYEHAFSKSLKHELNSRLLMQSRRLPEALTELEEGIRFNSKLDIRPDLFRHYAIKARSQILLKDIDGTQDTLSYAEGYLPHVQGAPHFLTNYLLCQFIFHLYRLEESIDTGNKAEEAQNQKNAIKQGKKSIRISKKTPENRTEALKLMGTYYWLIGKQNRSLSWWNKSIQEGKRLGALPELSRSYMEVGKRLLEPKSKYSELNGMSAKEYLKKARKLFTEMDLQWDLDELDRISGY